ncbi:MAG: PP2C family protein-serine/threonine phosphatase [Planctomycetota bacterium]
MSTGVNPYDRSKPWQERLASIVETMREVSRHSEPHAMVQAYRDRMGPGLFGRMLSISRRGEKPPRFVLARDSAWENQPNPWTERDKLPRMEGGLLGDLVFGNEVRYIKDLDLPADDPAASLLRGWRSLVALPVFDGGEALNMTVFLRKEPNAFDPDDLPNMFWTTNLFSRATHNLVLSDQVKRAYDMLDREARLIADLQRALLPPEMPRIPCLDVASYYRPATRAGGDYYDFFNQQDGTWALFIGDVSGHGSPAAVEMAITRTLAHVRAEKPFAPSEMLTYLNERLAGRLLVNPAFVTALCAVYDPRKGTIRYSSAGHHPPRLKRCSDGSLFNLDGAGSPPLGVVEKVGFRDAERELVEGDQLIFYTDGITEAMDKQGEMFGLDRLDGVLENCGVNAQALIETVVSELKAFTNGREWADDVTMLVARVTG